MRFEMLAAAEAGPKRQKLARSTVEAEVDNHRPWTPADRQHCPSKPRVELAALSVRPPAMLRWQKHRQPLGLMPVGWMFHSQALCSSLGAKLHSYCMAHMESGLEGGCGKETLHA